MGVRWSHKGWNPDTFRLRQVTYIYERVWFMLAAAAKSLQSCPTLGNPTDGSPPGSSVPGILQARILEWVTISFSNAWKWKVKVKSLSHAWLLATPWTGAYQAPPSMGFSRQEYWSGVPLPSLYQLVHLKSVSWGRASLAAISVVTIFILTFLLMLYCSMLLNL